jgi:hypothetical protein
MPCHIQHTHTKRKQDPRASDDDDKMMMMMMMMMKTNDNRERIPALIYTKKQDY